MKKLIKRWLGIDDFNVEVDQLGRGLRWADKIEALEKRISAIEAKVITRKFDLGDKVEIHEAAKGVVVGFVGKTPPYKYLVTIESGQGYMYSEHELTKQEDEKYGSDE